MKRRIFCAVMTVVLVLTMLPVIAAAEGAVEIAFTQRETKAGATQVQVGVDMSNNPGLVTATIPVTWNNDVLHLVNVIPSEDILSAGWIGMGMDEYKSNGTYYLAWDNDLAEADFTTEVGCLAELVFDIVDPSKDTETTLAFDMDDPIANVMNFDMEDLRETVTVNAANGTVSVAAEAGGDNPVVDPDAFAIAVNDSVVRIGETLTVELIVENNPGTLGAEIMVSYPEVFTLIDAVPGTSDEGKNIGFGSFTMTPAGNKVSPFKLSYDGQDADSSNGVIATLTFELAESIEVGEYDIVIDSASCVSAGDYSMITPVTVNGKVTVKSFTYGDVNDDGLINVVDVIMLRRYVATGYDLVNFITDAADVNDDGLINVVDVIMLRRYVATGYDVVIGGAK